MVHRAPATCALDSKAVDKTRREEDRKLFNCPKQLFGLLSEGAMAFGRSRNRLPIPGRSRKFPIMGKICLVSFSMHFHRSAYHLHSKG
jgi:hypothetical protein